MRNWNAGKLFSYKEIKAATNNFKEVIGHGSFGSVYLGKLQDGKLVAVKMRSDKSQLGADSFINEVHNLTFFSILSDNFGPLSSNIKRFLYVGVSFVTNSPSESRITRRVLSRVEATNTCIRVFTRWILGR